MAESATHRLFSYGTLRQPEVQLARFGRILDGRTDALPGFRVEFIAITDPEVIAASGSDRHPMVVASADPQDSVEGTVFEITAAELASADDYEVDDYARREVGLRSGSRAWAYLEAAGPSPADGQAPPTGPVQSVGLAAPDQ